jgi:membrane protein YqaA with SNARE-associated domain
MLLWRLIKQQYDFIIRIAATKLAVLGLYIFAALESIIIPIPADPLLVATVLARPKRWRQLALGCTVASVIGGVGGWALGTFFSPYLYEWLAMLHERLHAPAAFAAVEAGFAKFGIFLVFLGAFSPLPYKVIAVSAGIGGFGLLPFILTSIIGRGLRFTIVAGIAKNNGNHKIVILLITILICLFAGTLWLIR